MSAPDLASYLEEQEAAQSVADLGLWRVVGEPEWSAIFPPGDEPDPAIVKAIRTFAPNYVPLWLRKAYKSPTGDLTAYGYHVIGMHTEHAEDAQDDWEIVNVIRPPDWPARFNQGQINVVRVLWDDWRPGTWQRARNFPRQYVAYDWRLVEYLRRAVWRMKNTDVAKESIRELDEQLAAEDKAVEQLEADTKQELRDDAYSLLKDGKGERAWLNGPQFTGNEETNA